MPTKPSAGAATFTWLVTSAVVLAGATLSGTKLIALGQMAGWSAGLAWMLFVIVDGAGLAGSLVWRFGHTSGARNYGAFVLLESTALSLLGNIAAHVWQSDGTDSSAGVPVRNAAAHMPVGHLPMTVVIAVGAMVPIQIVLTVHMAMLLSERADTADEGTTGEATGAPLPVAEPATATDPGSASRVAPATKPDSAMTVVPLPATGTDGTASGTAEIAPVSDIAHHRRAHAPKPATPTTAATGANKTTVMRRVFDEYLQTGRLDELTGGELARRADANPSLGRKYLRQWRDEIAEQPTGGEQ